LRSGPQHFSQKSLLQKETEKHNKDTNDYKNTYMNHRNPQGAKIHQRRRVAYFPWKRPYETGENCADYRQPEYADHKGRDNKFHAAAAASGYGFINQKAQNQAIKTCKNNSADYGNGKIPGTPARQGIKNVYRDHTGADIRKINPVHALPEKNHPQADKTIGGAISDSLYSGLKNIKNPKPHERPFTF
jgi:hypothetical protein